MALESALALKQMDIIYIIVIVIDATRQNQSCKKKVKQGVGEQALVVRRSANKRSEETVDHCSRSNGHRSDPC